MTMYYKNISKKALIVLVGVVALLLAASAWALQPKQQSSSTPPGSIAGSVIHKSPIKVRPIQLESVPSVTFDHSSPNLAVPFVKDGTLFIAKVKKPASGATTTAEVSRQTVAKDVIGQIDRNPLTGEYFYQTLDPAHKNPSDISTWIGKANGSTTFFAKGIMSAVFSPGGSYIAMINENGKLTLISRDKNVYANYGSAGYPVFSPDSTKLAFFRMAMWGTDDMGGLTIINLVSGKTIATYNPAGGEYVPLAFSKDGNTLFFEEEMTPSTNPNRLNIRALSLATGKVRLVTTGPKKLLYLYSHARYIANQHLLMLSGIGNIVFVNTDTGRIKTINNIANSTPVGEGNTIITRSTKRSSAGTWSVVSAH